MSKIGDNNKTPLKLAHYKKKDESNLNKIIIIFFKNIIKFNNFINKIIKTWQVLQV